jgi:hypothetical protein
MKTKLWSVCISLALFAGVHPALAQLTNLGIAPAGNQTVLFWPATATNYVLQSTTNLISPNWVAVSNAVMLTAVTVTNTSPARFFRLFNTNFPTSGLVLFAKFSEGSGNTVADSSGNGHKGNLVNSPAWIPGVTDYALNFVSASQQSAGFGNLKLAGSNQCTFSMWMQKTNPAAIGLAALGCTSGTYNAIFLAWWTDGYVYGGVGDTTAYRYFYAPYVANTWIHFVMVYDGTQLQNSNRINIFINGVQATPVPGQPFALTAISTKIGAVSTNFSLAWDSNEGYESGRYDGVGVWNRVLSPTEIQQVYSNAAAGP